MRQPSPKNVILPVSLATALSLLGDTTLYTVLPTHTAEAGVTLASVGLLLSANRWVRLPLNGPAGLLLERLPRKPVFALAMLLGTLSTWLYALDNGLAVLLVARLLWGIAWVGIWVGGNTIVMDVTGDHDRGRWLGVYQVAFFLGAGGGAVLGGLLTDALGYHAAMAINTGLTLIGALAAWLFLPETRPARAADGGRDRETERPAPALPALRAEIGSAAAMMAANRLVQEGILLATLALFLQQTLGERVALGGVEIGTATLSGLSLGLTTVVAAAAAPISGALSDRSSRRWPVAAAAMLPGVLGFAILQLGTPAAIFAGLVGASVASGASANLSTALIGDLGLRGQHGRRLGGLFTVGDLASAAGPPLAFWLAPVIGLDGVYWLAAGIFFAVACLAFFWSRIDRRRSG